MHTQLRTSGGDVDGFGAILRQRRKAAGWGLREFAERVGYSHGYLGQIERCERPLNAVVVAAYDRALAAGGELDAAYAGGQAGGTDMRRRSILAMGALAAVPAMDRLVGRESLRHGLSAAVDVEHDEWAAIAAEYGRDYYLHPHDQLMAQLDLDLTLLRHHLAAATDQHRPLLLRAAGRLSVVMALGLVASDQAALARRWWATARRAADESGDADTRVLARAWDVVGGCYDGRPAAQVVALSDQVLPLLENTAPSAATCGLLAGRAQALSLAGRHTEATATVRRLSEQMGALPADVVADVESLWGWPEHRLAHTQSWVCTHAGLLADAHDAQERALALYPPSQQRLRTQVQLHRCAALIRAGHIPDGLRLAADALDQLPATQHNALVRTVARHAMQAVPDAERRRPVYGELMERVRG